MKFLFHKRGGFVQTDCEFLNMVSLLHSDILLLSLPFNIKYSYQFIVVGYLSIAVSERKEQQLAVAVECEVDVKFIRHVGQEVGQQSAFDFGERRSSGKSFRTGVTASPNLCKSRNT